MIKQCPRCGIPCQHDWQQIECDILKDGKHYECRICHIFGCTNARCEKLSPDKPAIFPIDYFQEHFDECMGHMYGRLQQKGIIEAESAYLEMRPLPVQRSLKQCELDQPSDTQLERDLLRSIYVKTYPLDKNGLKRSYNFMTTKLQRKGIIK